MTTTTAGRRTVRRTTAMVRSGGRCKPVIVTLTEDSIELRLLGERRRFRLSAATAYALAVQSFVEAEKARKRAARAAKRKQKR